MITLKKYSDLFQLVLLLALFFLATVHTQCPCPTQTSCQLVESSQAIVKANILSQTSGIDSVSFTANIKKSLKGNFIRNQQVTFSSDPNCVTLKTGKTYVLGLVTRGTGWWHDSCAIRGPRSLISNDLWKTIVKYPQRCPTTPVCLDQSGNTHQNGSSWSVGPCQTCTCVNGNSICVSVTCPPVTCQGAFIPTGQCCPVCPQISFGSCIFGGSIYLNGQVWNPDACRRCRCSNGVTSCNSTVCPPVSCLGAYVPAGQCCPICPQGSCVFEGNTYLNGQFWNPDSCRRCRCINGTTSCSFPICPAVTCPGAYVPLGECCPVCPQSTGRCLYDGVVYDNGQDWYLPGTCRRCHCSNGFTSCVDVQCLPTNCSNPYTPLGQCCPVCPHNTGQCEFEGGVYADGSDWSPSPCRRCHCNGGLVSCQTIQCPNVPCSNAYVPVGQCCPVCPQSTGQCLFQGSIYNNGQIWNPSVCRTCQCNNGITACVDEQCPQLACNNSYIPAGMCCPVCPPLRCQDEDGRTYYNGQHWSPTNCMSCSCTNGVINCSPYNCLQPTCPSAYTPPGECCPICRT